MSPPREHRWHTTSRALMLTALQALWLRDAKIRMMYAPLMDARKFTLPTELRHMKFFLRTFVVVVPS
jgi:hypothetical protein